jgi:type II secretory pathway pseudopilin PulG
MKISERSGGFAYLWTLMLVAMLGVGLSFAAESYQLGKRREQERELLFIGREFRDAIRSYYVASGMVTQREYPARLEDLLQDSRMAGTRRHLRRIYRDPMTGKAEWGLVRFGGRIIGVHSLSAVMPLKQSGFEPDEQAFEGKTSYREWQFVHAAPLTGQEEPRPASPLAPQAAPGGTL